jgi:NTE family protein
MNDQPVGPVDRGVQTTPDSTETAKREYLPDRKRKGVALCLSGGGSRAALFHLGVLRRLNETGVLAQVDTITSVSGGSILVGHLIQRVEAWQAATVKDPPVEAIVDFDSVVKEPFERLVRLNLRTSPLARRYLFPRNWLNDQAEIDGLTQLFRAYLVDRPLGTMPARPDFRICASDNAFGVNWTFGRDTMGDYQAGSSTGIADWIVARAVAASACFPPIYNAMNIHAKPSAFAGGDYSRPDRDRIVSGIRLSDGGLYDNLALEPVWKDHRIVIVSDGGSPFDAAPDQGPIARLKRYATVMGRQATALRKRWLIASYEEGVFQGVYLGVGTPVSRYELDKLPKPPPTFGYPAGLVENSISQIRTDLDAFSDIEIGVLQNHGYWVAEAGRLKHLSETDLKMKADVELKAPFPALVDPQEISGALSRSSSTEILGRGDWIRYLAPRRFWKGPLLSARS